MAEKKPFKERIKPDGDKLKKAAMPTLMDAGMAFTGGMIGSAIGWHSLYLGALAMYAGQYSETNTLTALGAGMFASVPFDLMSSGGANLRQAQNGGSLNGTSTGMKGRIETGKMRALAFKDAFAKKMFLDKIFKKKGKQPGEATTIPDGSGDGELDGLGFLGNAFDNLDQLQESLVASAMDFQAANPGAVPMLEAGDPGGDFMDIEDLDTMDVIDAPGEFEAMAELQTVSGIDFDTM